MPRGIGIPIEGHSDRRVLQAHRTTIFPYYDLAVSEFSSGGMPRGRDTAEPRCDGIQAPPYRGPMIRAERGEPMRSIAWLSEKGGTGKTTSAVNTAVALAKLGKRVLVIDADPQANASLVFLKGETPEPPTLYHVLTNTADAGDTIRPTPTKGLSLLPADTLLADANISLASEMGRERRLRLALRGVDESFDFVVIDTSPQRTLINVNVLNYVSEVYCPVDPGIFSLSGLVKLQGAISEVVKFLDNQELRLRGLVLTRTAHDNVSRDVEKQVRATFGNLACESSIPANTKIGEAQCAVSVGPGLRPALARREGLHGPDSGDHPSWRDTRGWERKHPHC